MDYQYEYIKLKAKYTRMENIYKKRLEKANEDKRIMFDKLNQPFQFAQFDLELVELLKQVSIVTRITQHDIMSKCRKKSFVTARQILCYFARVHMKKTTTCIGAFLNVDHTTVLHHTKRMQDYLDLKYQPETEYLELLKNNVGTYIEETERICPHFS
jgi:chromosomal replication initiation ATPase DnaA